MMDKRGIWAGWLVVGLGTGCDEHAEAEPADPVLEARGPEEAVGASHRGSQALSDGAGPSAPSEQTAGFELDVAKDGADLVLTWTEQGEGATYEVWASDDPYFGPDDEDAERLAEGIEGGAYVHAGGNDAVSRYYRVRVEGLDQTSTTAGKVVTALEPGYTKLGLCLLSEIDTAQELFEDMDSPVVSAHVWSAEQQGWVWTWSATPVELVLETGRVVSVRHDEATAVEPGTHAMVGRVPVHGDVQIELLPGDNLVTLLPSRGDLRLASEVLAAVEHATRIGRWDAATQTTHWYPDADDFEVSPCSPLHVEVAAPSTWPPAGYRRVIGPAGGTIEAYDGAVRLDVPSGALAEDTELRITPYDYPLDGGAAVPTLALEPHDIPFAVPVTLTMHYRGRDEAVEDADASAWLLRYSTDGTEAVLETVNDVEAGTLTASLDTFSWVSTGVVCNTGYPSALTVTGANAPIRVDEQVTLTAGFDAAFDAALASGNFFAMQTVSGMQWEAQLAVVGLDPDGASADVTGVAPGATEVTATARTCWLYENLATAQAPIEVITELSDTQAISVMTCADRQALGECPSNGGCAVGCADGRCDPSALNENSPCQTDGNVCTAQTCQGGSCLPAPAGNLVCNDGNVCTIDGCNAASGCTFTPNAGQACDTDGRPCTVQGCSAAGACDVTAQIPNACGCNSNLDGCLWLSFTCGPWYAICAAACIDQYNQCHFGACGCLW